MKSKAKRAEPRFQPVNALKHKRHTLISSFIIFVLTIIVFYPVLQNSFVNWDDDRNLLDNLNFRGLGWTQLHWMFTTFHMTLYRPLTWMTLGLDYLFWGMNPFGYHLTSLVLHATNAVLVYLVAVRLLNLGFSSPKVTREFSLELSAGCAALIFALHPLRVEPVAWASARNDVLSGFWKQTQVWYSSENLEDMRSLSTQDQVTLITIWAMHCSQGVNWIRRLTILNRRCGFYSPAAYRPLPATK